MTRDKLREAFAIVSKPLTAAGYSDQVKDAYALLEANEFGIALENLCSNLYECDCPVPIRAYKLFAEVGTAMGIESRPWELLKGQVVA